MNDAYLAHYGVPGMKWGKRKVRAIITSRKKSRALQVKKAKAVAKNRNASASDSTRAEYLAKSTRSRVAQNAKAVVVNEVISSIFTGKFTRMASYSAADWKREAKSLATKTAVNTAMNDALAKSAMKKYDNAGRKKDGKGPRIVTREDFATSAIQVAATIGPIAAKVAGSKMRAAQAEKAKNQANFEKWGGNILSEKVNNVIWQSGNTSVIDNSDAAKYR